MKSDNSLILVLNEMEAQNQRIAFAKPFHYVIMWERHDIFKQTMEGACGAASALNVGELRDKLKSTSRALTD